MQPQAYWDEIAAGYEDLYNTEWSRSEDARLQTLLRQALAQAPGTRVLDIGCGTGLAYRLLGPGRVNYTGLDISPEMLLRLRARHSDVTTVQGSLDEVARVAHPGAFDLIVAVNAVCSFARDAEALVRDLHMLLRDEGVLFASFLNRRSLRRSARLARGAAEKYRTRGDADATRHIRAITYSGRDLYGLAQGRGFEEIHIGYQSVLGGVLETAWAIPVERALSRTVPFLGHEVHLVCRKRGQTRE